MGTLDEIVTVRAAVPIGDHNKRGIRYNIDGLWDSLIAMRDDLKARGVLRAGFDDTLKVARSLDEIAGFIG